MAAWFYNLFIEVLAIIQIIGLVLGVKILKSSYRRVVIAGIVLL